MSGSMMRRVPVQRPLVGASERSKCRRAAEGRARSATPPPGAGRGCRRRDPRSRAWRCSVPSGATAHGGPSGRAGKGSPTAPRGRRPPWTGRVMDQALSCVCRASRRRRAGFGAVPTACPPLPTGLQVAGRPGFRSSGLGTLRSSGLGILRLGGLAVLRAGGLMQRRPGVSPSRLQRAAGTVLVSALGSSASAARSASQRSASRAAWQPEPAAVIAWR